MSPQQTAASTAVMTSSGAGEGTTPSRTNGGAPPYLEQVPRFEAQRLGGMARLLLPQEHRAAGARRQRLVRVEAVQARVLRRAVESFRRGSRTEVEHDLPLG
jgi:hypothetical protein